VYRWHQAHHARGWIDALLATNVFFPREISPSCTNENWPSDFFRQQRKSQSLWQRNYEDPEFSCAPWHLTQGPRHLGLAYWRIKLPLAQQYNTNDNGNLACGLHQSH